MLGAQIVGIAFRPEIIVCSRLRLLARQLRWRGVQIARFARRLRGLGGGAAEIVHVADGVAEVPGAFALRRRRRSSVEQPLARGRRRARRRGVARFARRPASAWPARRGAFRRRVMSEGARSRRGGGAAAGRGSRGSARALRAASASTLRIASSRAKRSLVISDFGKRRVDAPQLRDQRVARPFIKCPSSFARASFKAVDGTGDQRMIVGHYVSLRSPPCFFILISRLERVLHQDRVFPFRAR